jgi:peptidoglycan/xylan/chitin deacetylase (PgdA/CDA1 family)
MSIMAILFEIPSRGARALACILTIGLTSSAFPAPVHHDEWRLRAQIEEPAAQPPTCFNSGALGTSRIAGIGTQGGLAVGLKTYPRTLRLADHEVVLTFDDGPLPATTPAVLDALARQCVLATFFLIGRNAAAHPDLVRREIAAGHTVGHHSFSHPAATLRGLPDEVARRDIMQGVEADEKAAGLWRSFGSAPHVPFFRFPGFADSKPLLAWLKDQNVGVFSADIWASDWNPMTPDAELDLLMARIERAGRGIILLHDIKSQTATMLPRLLEELKRRNYRIVHLVPGVGKAETFDAPASWTSETETFLSRTMPRAGMRVSTPRSVAAPRAIGFPLHVPTRSKV